MNTFRASPQLYCTAQKTLKINGAGERNRTLAIITHGPSHGVLLQRASTT
jgi:hypothetical protein